MKIRKKILLRTTKCEKEIIRSSSKYMKLMTYSSRRVNYHFLRKLLVTPLLKFKSMIKLLRLKSENKLIILSLMRGFVLSFQI